MSANGVVSTNGVARANGVAPITGTYTKYATVAPLGSALYRKNDVTISLIASAVNKTTNLVHNKNNNCIIYGWRQFLISLTKITGQRNIKMRLTDEIRPFQSKTKYIKSNE